MILKGQDPWFARLNKTKMSCTVKKLESKTCRDFLTLLSGTRATSSRRYWKENNIKYCWSLSLNTNLIVGKEPEGLTALDLQWTVIKISSYLFGCQSWFLIKNKGCQKYNETQKWDKPNLYSDLFPKILMVNRPSDLFFLLLNFCKYVSENNSDESIYRTK